MTRQLSLFRILAIILGFIALLMIPSLLMALILKETGMVRALALPLSAAAAVGFFAAILIPAKMGGVRSQDGFLLVFLAWVLVSLLGGLPYYLSGLGISFTDAVFESACGFATTGGTSIQNVEILPRSLLFWRATSHLAGGMGIILLTAALMPILGVGSFALIKAETPGPEKERLTPNIAVTAKLLWGIYCALTVIVILLYRSGGMNWFDAVCHGFTTIATGGVSTKNAGIASFNSPAVEWTTTIFMLLGAVNFNLYFKLLKGNFRDIRYNSELRAYLLIFLCASTIIVLSLIPHYGSVSRAIRYGTFQTAAILTTTGNAIADYEKWPALTQAVLLCLMCIGGCSGSTAGGIKVIRHTVLFKQTSNEVRRILFPQGVFSIQLNHKVGRKDVVYGVAGFVFLYMVVVTITALITASSGTDTLSAFSAALSTTGNIGLGFGAVGPSRFYGAFPDYVKWTFSLAMIAGRLELWTMLIFFNPEYWRR